jgi:hypothetical protein
MPGVALAGTSAVTLNHSLVNLVLFYRANLAKPGGEGQKEQGSSLTAQFHCSAGGKVAPPAGEQALATLCIY